MRKIPSKVEYSLTNKGETLLPVLEQLCERGEKNRNN
jgi:DNA-binding HxlR family transcriptional regulator